MKIGYSPVASDRVVYIPVYVKAIVTSAAVTKDNAQPHRTKFESVKRLVRCFEVKCGDHKDSSNDIDCWKCFDPTRWLDPKRKRMCKWLLSQHGNGGKVQEVDCKGNAELAFSIQ